MVVSEQYPKGLGSTVQELDLTGAKLVFPKTKFSMVLPEVEAVLAETPGVRSVVLFGVEVSPVISDDTEICVIMDMDTLSAVTFSRKPKLADRRL